MLLLTQKNKIKINGSSLTYNKIAFASLANPPNCFRHKQMTWTQSLKLHKTGPQQPSKRISIQNNYTCTNLNDQIMCHKNTLVNMSELIEQIIRRIQYTANVTTQ